MVGLTEDLGINMISFTRKNAISVALGLAILGPVQGNAANATFNVADVTLGTSGTSVSAQSYSMDNVPFVYNTNYALGKSDTYKYNYRGTYQCSGLDAMVRLPVVGTINSQSIYGITEEVGVLVWAGDTRYATARPMSGNNWTNVFNQFCTTTSQGYSVYVRPVILKRNTSSVIDIPYTTIGSIRIRNMSGGTYYGKTEFTFSLTNMSIINGAKSCTWINGASQINANIPLNTISLMSIPFVGSESQGGGGRLSLRCPAGVSVFATLTDATEPSNTGSILTLTQDSTATGVGLKIYKNNDTTPLSFGPPSPIKGNLNQWKLSTGTETTPSVVFRASYVNTDGSPTAGSVKGIATITFSYQ